MVLEGSMVTMIPPLMMRSALGFCWAKVVAVSTKIAAQVVAVAFSICIEGERPPGGWSGTDRYRGSKPHPSKAFFAAFAMWLNSAPTQNILVVNAPGDVTPFYPEVKHRSPLLSSLRV